MPTKDKTVPLYTFKKKKIKKIKHQIVNTYIKVCLNSTRHHSVNHVLYGKFIILHLIFFSSSLFLQNKVIYIKVLGTKHQHTFLFSICYTKICFYCGFAYIRWLLGVLAYSGAGSRKLRLRLRRVGRRRCGRERQ